MTRPLAVGASALLMLIGSAEPSHARTVRFTCRAAQPTFHPFICDIESTDDPSSCTFCFTPSVAFIAGCRGGGRQNPCRVLPFHSGGCANMPADAPRDQFTVALPASGGHGATVTLLPPVTDSAESAIVLHCRRARRRPNG